jgi:hypothetical protein
MREQLLEYIDEDQLPLEYAGPNPPPGCVALGQGPCELILREHVAKLDRGESTADVEVVIGLNGQLKKHGMSLVPSSLATENEVHVPSPPNSPKSSHLVAPPPMGGHKRSLSTSSSSQVAFLCVFFFVPNVDGRDVFES